MSFFERLGVVASGVCLVHCLLTPLAVAFAPGILQSFGGEAWETPLLLSGLVLMGLPLLITRKARTLRRVVFWSLGAFAFALFTLVERDALAPVVSLCLAVSVWRGRSECPCASDLPLSDVDVPPLR